VTRLIASVLAAVFRFFSGTVRNARTFHPDGRTFFGTVTPDASDPSLTRAGTMLEGRVLMRLGMGIVKTHAPAWIKSILPDAPSVAVRFSPAARAEDISVADRAEQELDVLFTAGGDRLWKLLLNLTLGCGRWFGLKQFDYFQNRYFTDVRYRVPDCGLDVWLRLTPAAFGKGADAARAADPQSREQGLTDAAAQGATFLIEAQPVGDSGASFVPFARIRFDRETDIDQETLRFLPLAGRGFHPYGIFTTLREKVYPASAHARPASRTERRLRDERGFFFRLFHRRHETGERAPRRFGFKQLVYGLCLLVVALLLVSLAYAAGRFLPNYSLTDPPVAADGKYSQADDEQRFKYGSTGGEANLGFPILMWQAAPLVCAEKLKTMMGKRIAADYVARVRNYQPRADGGPDESRKALSREGYKAFGLIYEKDKEDPRKERDIPVGASMRRNLGLDRVFVNCAFCHSSTVRVSAEAEPRLVLGMPANLLDIRAFEDFLFSCTSGPKFITANVVPEIENMSGRLSLLDRYLIYPLAIWIVRDRVQFLSNRLGFFRKQPPWGPGRVDTFSNAKGIFNWPWEKLPDWTQGKEPEPDQIGTVDFPSIWRQGARQKRSSDGCPMELHWDGNNDTVQERDLSAAFGTGALPTNIDHSNLERIEDWLLERSEPPKFTDFFPDAFDPELAKLGQKIYAQHCADCHGVDGKDFTGKYVGKVTPIDEIGTDRRRLDNYTEELAATQSMLYAGEKKSGRVPAAGSPDPLANCRPQPHGDAQEHTYRFKRFQKTAGYANSPLDGIWLRAPYLHNGSVPTLRDLLKPPDDRPTSYYRGNDEYDPRALGFKSDASARPDGRAYFHYKTKHPGNSAKGHRYGTELPENEKDALIEYLKTF
jgi:RoxA-like, cytochrome c-like/Cytochrome c